MIFLSVDDDDDADDMIKVTRNIEGHIVTHPPLASREISNVTVFKNVWDVWNA